MKTREDFSGETEGKVSDMKRKHRTCSKMRRWSRSVLSRTEPGAGSRQDGEGARQVLVVGFPREDGVEGGEQGRL